MDTIPQVVKTREMADEPLSGSAGEKTDEGRIEL
jgi:hypothetical protein